MRIPYRNKLLLKKIWRILLISLGVCMLLAIALLVYFEPYFVYDRSGAHLDYGSTPTTAEENTSAQLIAVEPPEIIYDTAEPEEIHLADIGGYYITTSMLRQPEKVLEQIRSLTEPCAVMLELKSIYGNFYYSTAIDGAQRASVDVTVVDELIDYLRDNDFYMIASVCAFSDSNFALDNQSCGLPLSNGALWMDENGCYWLDPSDEAVISYLVQITRELASLGFDEVAFFDFRFPTSASIHYESDLTGTELIRDAAKDLTTFFTGSQVTISFVTDSTDFPAAVCKGRLYLEGVDGSKVERFTQAYGSYALKEQIFLANSRDTRFDGLAVLKPLISE